MTLVFLNLLQHRSHCPSFVPRIKPRTLHPTVLCRLYFGDILQSLDSMCEVEVPNRNNVPPEADCQKACLETLRGASRRNFIKEWDGGRT